MPVLMTGVGRASPSPEWSRSAMMVMVRMRTRMLATRREERILLKSRGEIVPERVGRVIEIVDGSHVGFEDLKKIEQSRSRQT